MSFRAAAVIALGRRLTGVNYSIKWIGIAARSIDKKQKNNVYAENHAKSRANQHMVGRIGEDNTQHNENGPAAQGIVTAFQLDTKCLHTANFENHIYCSEVDSDCQCETYILTQ